MTPSKIWRSLSPSMRATLLGEAGLPIGSPSIDALIEAGLAKPGWDRPAFASGAARRALGRRGLLEIGQTVPMPGSGPGWHTPRTVTDIGRQVAEYGRSLLAPSMLTAGTITDAQIRDERARAVRVRDWTLAERCDAALRRSEDIWLREDIAAAINARQENR